MSIITVTSWSHAVHTLTLVSSLSTTCLKSVLSFSTFSNFIFNCSSSIYKYNSKYLINVMYEEIYKYVNPSMMGFAWVQTNFSHVLERKKNPPQERVSWQNELCIVVAHFYETGYGTWLCFVFWYVYCYILLMSPMYLLNMLAVVKYSLPF